MQKRRPPEHERQDFSDRRRVLFRRRLASEIGVAARGFDDGGADEQRERQAGKADEIKRLPPADMLRPPSADGRADGRADRYGQREDRKGGAAFEFRKVVRDERMRRRTAAGLADGGEYARAE